MAWLKFFGLALSLVTVQTKALPGITSSSKRGPDASPDPSLAVSVELNGETYINKGLVAFGLIPSNFRESTGDTLGGIGSSIALKPGSWSQHRNNKFKGTLIVQPDRGFNVNHTIDYQARHHEIDFVFSPYYGTSQLSFADAQKTLQLEYQKTILHWDRKHKKTSGLDPLGVRPPQQGFPGDPTADPEMPIASADYDHLSVDPEGLVVNKDGSIWVSDEYGPYIYRFSKKGRLIQTIQPPAALLPHNAQGVLNFTADTKAKTGRNSNQGFEGLTLDTKTKTLYALLQSATFQDGGTNDTLSRHTRLLAWDISHPDTKRPTLVGEWVVPLPQSGKGKTLGTSEVHFIKGNVFFSLTRDGDGRGGGDTKSKYKQADLFDISQATDIHGTQFDDPAHPIAVNGVLDPNIIPATYVSFVNYIDATQLARFGMHNGGVDDQTLIGAKWESLALAPCGDDDNPDDFFLFTASDNDFISTDGVSLGVPFNAGLDNDNQFFVFRVTLPGVGERHRHGHDSGSH